MKTTKQHNRELLKKHIPNLHRYGEFMYVPDGPWAISYPKGIESPYVKLKFRKRSIRFNEEKDILEHKDIEKLRTPLPYPIMKQGSVYTYEPDENTRTTVVCLKSTTGNEEVFKGMFVYLKHDSSKDIGDTSNNFVCEIFKLSPIT